MDKTPAVLFSVGGTRAVTSVMSEQFSSEYPVLSTSTPPDQLPIKDESSVIPQNDPPPLVPWKAVVKHKKPIKQILKTKHPVKKRYLTAGVAVNEKNARHLEKERSPFSYPKDMEIFAHSVMTKAWRNDRRIEELQDKYFNRTSYKEKQKLDLLKRLYVEETPAEGMRTVTDINPNYFKIIQGRPIPEKLDIREYIETVRDSLRTKIVIGYREDDIALIDETLLLEQTIIDVVKENLQSYVDTFENFLLEDHSSAMRLLRESDEVSKITFNKYLEHNAVAQKHAALNSSLFNVEDKWRMCKTYQKFLYAVSPLSWKTEQKLSQRRTSIYKPQDPTDEFMAGLYRKSILTKGISLQDIVDEFMEETVDDAPPLLYFTKPEELMDVFRFMEMQNLNSLLHTEQLARPLEGIKDNMKSAVKAFDKEIKNLQEIVDVLEGGILWEENRVKYLEELATNLIENEFKNLIVEEDVLNLQVIVEDVYENRIGPNDANINIVEMMKAVEELYRRELLFFDMIPSKELASLEGSYYEEEIMMMRLAERAAKQYDELERITNNIRRAYDPPEQRRTQRELKKRTPPVNPPKRVQPPPRSLTEREKDYLEYFTQFCFFKDDPKEYGIDTSSDSVEKKLSIIPKKSSLENSLEDT
ncbi:coiled-coil domain-containing protein 38 [Anoplophora glabripennis]|uniref:coiled-coil domain-containing protein 38 n=1 Tax=Anoplophora glabripennis TaxID=217634 RepID=UPI0008741358|nr:coiled-coil domain-containing protein 38 [Anoplophora glabripennis]